MPRNRGIVSPGGAETAASKDMNGKMAILLLTIAPLLGLLFMTVVTAQANNRGGGTAMVNAPYIIVIILMVVAFLPLSKTELTLSRPKCITLRRRPR